MKHRLILALLLLCHSPSLYAQSSGAFFPAGSMAAARTGHTATLLQDGRVLIAGGADESNHILGSVEIYDPDKRSFVAAGDMTTPRRWHTANLLPDGRVLIVGGEATPPTAINGIQPGRTAELFDPSTGSFTATGSLQMGREGFNATLLANGKVLITGGVANVTDAGYTIGDAEIYDPATGTFANAGSYAGSLASLSDVGVFGYASVSALLADGTVLYAAEPASQVYSLATSTFSLRGPIYVQWSLPGGNSIVPDYLAEQTATVMLNGRTLLTGGEQEDSGYFRTAQLYDAPTGAYIRTGDMLKPRGGHSATLLPDGRVLIAGGTTEACADNGCWTSGPDASAELYDPVEGVFSDAGLMTTNRDGHTATLLESGDVLIVGGYSYSGPSPVGGFIETATASAELYHPAAASPAPALFSIADGTGQGIVWHAATGQLASPQNPAVAGEILSMYVTSLASGGVVPPQVAVGGQSAEILFFGDAPGYAGYSQINFRTPSSVAAGSAVSVRVNYLARVSNQVTIGVR